MSDIFSKANLGNSLDQGNIEADKVHVNVDGVTILRDVATGVLSTPLPSGTCEEIAVIAAYGYVNPGGALINGFNIANVSQLGTGQYQVVFTAPMSTANYPVVFGNVNSFATRDGRHTEVIAGSQTINGFSYYTAVGDNGGAADTLVNAQANFHVADTKIVFVCDAVGP